VEPIRFVDFDNDRCNRVDFAASWDLTVLRGISDRLRVYGRLEKLFDEKHEEAAGVAVPGFRFMAGLEARS
jgi:outer membrane cobalamin receptor